MLSINFTQETTLQRNSSPLNNDNQMENLEFQPHEVLGEQGTMHVNNGIENVINEMKLICQRKADIRLETAIKLDTLGFVWELDSIDLRSKEPEL